MKSTGSLSSAREAYGCIAWALLITALHVGITLQGVSTDGSYQERYHRLVQHDSYWFLNIIDRGYQSPVPPSPVKSMEISNVAFFPGIILWAKAVIASLGLDPKTGLTLAAQLATWGFWTYFLLVARQRLRFSAAQCAVAVALVLAHPAAFFLIAAYSESLFLLLLLGFMFWSVIPGRRAFIIAALHGVAMTGTRIAGVPATAFPFVQAWFRIRFPAYQATQVDQGGTRPPGAFSATNAFVAPLRHRFTFSPALLRAAALMLIALTGLAAFFLYCHLRFGHWDFYLMTQQAGWGVRADYLGLFKLAAYQQWTPNWRVASQVGQFLVPVTVIAFVGLAVWEITAARRQVTQWRKRIGFYFVGFVLFYISVSGVFSVRLESMTRYHFCTHVFLMLGAVHAFAEIGPRRRGIRTALITLTTLAALFGAWLHFTFSSQFVRGGWVA